MAIVFDAASQAGLDEALAKGAANAEELASRCGLDAHAVQVVLESLVVWSLVQPEDDGRFSRNS
jgi:DNA-binding IclR family transcriptional regulator